MAWRYSLPTLRFRSLPAQTAAPRHFGSVDRPILASSRSRFNIIFPKPASLQRHLTQQKRRPESTQFSIGLRRHRTRQSRHLTTLANNFVTEGGAGCPPSGSCTAGASCSVSFLPSSTPH